MRVGVSVYYVAIKFSTIYCQFDERIFSYYLDALTKCACVSVSDKHVVQANIFDSNESILADKRHGTQTSRRFVHLRDYNLAQNREKGGTGERREKKRK